MRRASTVARATGRHVTAAAGQDPARAPGPPTGTVRSDAAARERPSWTFLTNHAHALLCVARNPRMRVREIALAVGVTERCVQGILAELERDGYVTRVHQGRRNLYEVHADLPLRHPVEWHRQVSELLSLVPAARDADGSRSGPRPAPRPAQRPRSRSKASK